MSEFLAVCARLAGNELISAECKALTGSLPAQDGIAICREIERIRQAAFISCGLQLIAKDASLEGLVAQIASLNIRAEDFRIEVLQHTKQRISGRQAVIAVADVLKGYPNLDTPRQRFMILVRKDGLYFGEVVVVSDQSYRPHAYKPYHMSSSLPSQIARALVNLVAPPARSILDPCCGTGSILLEAQALNLTAYGSDLNPRMVGMSKKNLAHFGYTAVVQLLDARLCQQKVEAVVTDLPYGRFQIRDEGNIRAIVARCAELAPAAVFVAGEDLSSWLEDSGYGEIEVCQVAKSNGLRRYIHQAQSKAYQ